MPPRRRLHFKRLLALIVLVLLCLLLLELNRFLPGVWPGGGGKTGSRPVATGLKDDPSRVRPPDRPAGEAERPAGLRVEVVAPPGDAADGEAQVLAGSAAKSVALSAGRGAVE